MCTKYLQGRIAELADEKYYASPKAITAMVKK